MTRPAVSVVMPFAGDAAAARAALATLHALHTEPEDELVLADNSGTVTAPPPRVTVVRADGERSPAHARNAGAARAHSEWILFLDADCLAPADLLDRYFAEPPDPEVGALAGEVRPAPDRSTVAARYGAARSFLSQGSHLAHPYLPRAVAANLLVRRAAFEQIGGFYEGLRAAEDTDFSWRLQHAGWRLELRPAAAVEHRYRTSVRELRRQWRGYAAGRAWLRRRYADFTPEPAVRRAVRRVWRRRSAVGSSRPRVSAHPDRGGGALERSRHLALDALLGIEELAGFALSNRPADVLVRGRAANVVLVADHFPARGDPLVDFALTLKGARIEAESRPATPWPEVARELQIAYREDDGAGTRLLAVAWLVARHPLRSGLDLLRRRPGAPSLTSLAPAALRLSRTRPARVHALGGEEVQATAGRLAYLVGRDLDRR